MNLAIASPAGSGYSETFIHMQMERLPCVLRIHGGPVAAETVPGGPIRWRKSPAGLQDLLCGLRCPEGRQYALQSRELARRLRQHRVGVVLANYGRTGVALRPLCRELSIPLVVHFHGYDAHMTSEVERRRDEYRELGRDCARVIAVSERMRAALIDLGIPAAKISLVRYGVDPDRFVQRSAVPDAPLFFGVGRFVDKKAPYFTLLAFREAWRKNPAAKLVLGGDGPLFETTRNLAQHMGMEPAVEFAGVISPDEVAGWMRRATAFVQHSVTPRWGPDAGDSEGTPVAMLEAMMTGVPVIGTRHAGMGEVVEDGVSGCLVEERDVAGMAAAMIKLMESADESARMGEAARQRALEQHTASCYMQQLSEVMETCGLGVGGAER